MAVSDDFRDFVLEQLRPAGKVAPRRMFGGIGLYLDEVFFALIDDDALYFKTDDSNRARYESAGSRPFCPYPDRPEKSMGYWEVPAEVLEEPEQLTAWAREAVQVALAAQSGKPARKHSRVRRRTPRRR